MEAFEETVKEGSKRGSSFIDHVFRLDEQQQGVLLNIVQYTLIGFVPILVMLYLVRTYVPEPDDHKATLMILVEIIGQILFMFVFIYFIHRLITFVPTYSGYRYSEFNFTTTILGILMILLSIKTKLGEKVQIIVERTIELLGGETSYGGSVGAPGSGSGGAGGASGGGGGAVRITQPLSQPYAGGVPGGMVGGGMAPPNPVLTANRNTGTADYGLSQASQQQQHFNSTYAQNVGGGMPGGMMSFEPMAANEVIGSKF
jgi:hypothetical protein